MFTYMGDYPVKNVELANHIVDNVNMSARQTAMICFDYESVPTRYKACQAAIDAIKKDIDLMSARDQVPEMRKLITDVEKAYNEQLRVRVEFLAAVNANNFELAQHLRTTTFATAIQCTQDEAQKLADYAMAEAYNFAYVESSAEVSATVRNLILIAIAIAAILIVVAIFIILGITRPLNKAVHAAEKISDGDFEVDLETTSSDETGALLRSLERMVESFNSMDKDLITVTNKIIDGNLSYRTDVNKHKGNFKSIMNAINSLVEAFIDPIKLTANFLQKVADGDSNLQKVTKDYKGDFNDIKNNINATADTLFLFLGELNELSDKAREGNLSKRADTSRSKGA